MTLRPIIDAGPSLNFFSINQERLLIATLGPLSAPETVQQEVLRKARQEARFAPAARVWQRLGSRYLQVLSDDQTPELAAAVQRITGRPMPERLRQSRDLGELMVVAHAAVAAEAGAHVTVLIDDGGGARMTAAEARLLKRRADRGDAVGAIRLVNTPMVLQRAAGTDHIPDRAAMRDIYKRLRTLDDGLPPIEATRLLDDDLWK